MQSIKVGILGLGTVGAGTADVLQSNAEEIQRRVGCRIEVAMASVRDLSIERACDCDTFTLTDDPYEVVNNSDLDIVVELIGGESLAKDLVLAAIDNGKHVVTANKALIALHGNELFAAAQAKGVAILFESSVAGGISIVKSIREGLAGNQIQLVAGIINGTGNFILTEMRDKGRSFDDVLAEAQALGYAEADPTFDVEGIDAAHKLTILASIAFGIPLQFDKVYTEGISQLNLEDINYAEGLGYQIKHLGIAKATEQGLELRVHPTLIPESQLIANVDGVMNAVLVKGNAVGDTLHYGAGAGAKPTASSVVADIIDLARTIYAERRPSESESRTEYPIPHLGFQSSAIIEQTIKSPDQFNSAYYLRIEAADVAGVMSKLTSVFAELEISIEGITQKEPATGQDSVSVILITQRTIEGRIDSAIEKIRGIDQINPEIVKIRVEHLS